MQKQDFFNYCEWLFPIIEQLETQISTQNRAIGMLAERLTSYYLYKLENSGRNTLKTSLCERPPMMTFSYLLSQIFDARVATKTTGSKHVKFTIFGLKFNVKLRKDKFK